MTLLEDPPREVIHNQRTQVVPTGLPSWLRKKVIGLKAGESAEGMTEQDPTLTEPRSRFSIASLQGHCECYLEWKPSCSRWRIGQEGWACNLSKNCKDKIKERLEQEVQEEA